MHGLILSGGEGTRLGPLGLQRSKCLVTVGGRPMLVHQYELLRDSGCDAVTVITSPGARHQVEEVVKNINLPIRVLEQSAYGRGPVAAIWTGLSGLEDSHVKILFADTLLSLEDMPGNVTHVVLGKAKTSRPFCLYASGRFRDTLAYEGEDVMIGALTLHVADARRAAEYRLSSSGMAAFLNDVHLSLITHTSSWQDTGDLKSLAAANRNHFISRSFNEVQLDERGIIVKHGSSLGEEALAMSNPPRRARHLYPRVYDTWTHDGAHHPHYSMEFVPLPSLAELYLYWPREPRTWTHIIEKLSSDLALYHWPPEQELATDFDVRARTMYVDHLKLRHITAEFPPDEEIYVNGRPLVTGQRLLDTALRVGQKLTRSAWPAMIHGDPNFTNVLWSLETSTFRLLDARGSWGGAGVVGDQAYDAAKIAYSPIFSRIVHGLYELEGPYQNLRMTELNLDPVVNAPLLDYFDDESHLRMLCGWLLFSAAPLHLGKERTAMYISGARLLQEFV